MVSLTLSEAILFRLLQDLFGKDRVLPFMSVMAVCGGAMPDDYFAAEPPNEGLLNWSKHNKCLFVIVDKDDESKLVVEFFNGYKSAVSFEEAEHQRYLKPLLEHLRITYVTLSEEELGVISSHGKDAFCRFFEERVLEGLSKVGST